jgi:phospholipid/cholesterol/gamma-HCH transport system permease protein
MSCRIEWTPGRVEIHGVIGAADIDAVDAAISSAAVGDAPVVLDLSGCDGADLVSAATIRERSASGAGAGRAVELTGVPDSLTAVFSEMEEHARSYSPPRAEAGIHDQIEEIGGKVAEISGTVLGLKSFLARSVRAVAAIWRNPKLLRLHLVLYYMEQSGVRAIPIISTLCWMLGVILGFQAGYQLKSFAAEAFMPDLIAYGMTWEIAPMLAAVLVAGRSGSAFAAELGTMKVRQEIDALKVMGMDEWGYLVTPKMLALMAVMPFLVLVADFFGLLGGLLIGGWYLDMPASVYMARLDLVMMPIDIYWGMLKSLVFAVIIANVGCYMGMRVRGGAAEVGRATTSAVVTGIFLVIVADALISLIFVHVRPEMVV